MAPCLLALNAGSSSLKFALLRHRSDVLARGVLDGLDGTQHLTAHDGGGAPLDGPAWPQGRALDFDDRIDRLLSWIEQLAGNDGLGAVGHRVVHGGRAHTAPVRVTAEILASLEALTPLAPLHQPHSLSPILAISKRRPSMAQVACFDTAFHSTMPAVATRLALPRHWEDQGVRRYGFHGLSYEFIARLLPSVSPRLASGRTIVAHLGNGASLCAMRGGESIETTMSFTALDGLVMGTRCGALDPGVVLYMIRSAAMTVADIEHELYERSGLLGVSGEASDMRTLLASSTAHAAEAVALFTYRIAREAASLAGALGGLDGFVFTGGIGEHSTDIRTAVCERLAWLGVTKGHDEDAPGVRRISGADSRVEVFVVPTDEEAMIGQHTAELLAGGRFAQDAK